MKKYSKIRKGFTLVELLTVIAIIGILAAISFSAGPAAMGMVRRMVAGNNLRSIAIAAKNYSDQNRGRVIREGGEPEKGRANSPADYAEILARAGLLTDASIWYVESDDALEDQEIPKTVLSEVTTGTNQLRDVKPVSWAVVVNRKKSPKNESLYPVAWLRGLNTSGEWGEDAPFGERRGIIVFADTNVRQVDSLQIEDNMLLSADGKTQTSNYQEAIGDTAKVKQDSK